MSGIPPELRALFDALGIDPSMVIEIGEGEAMKHLVTTDALPGQDIEGENVVHAHKRPANFRHNDPPPAKLCEPVPGIKEADRQSCPMAYMRFYDAGGGRGEWYVLGMDRAERAFCWVRSPWDPQYDEFGVVDLTAWDYYRQIFECGPIVLDPDFRPTPFNAATGELKPDDRQED